MPPDPQHQQQTALEAWRALQVIVAAAGALLLLDKAMKLFRRR
jgi:hypothetical protein